MDLNVGKIRSKNEKNRLMESELMESAENGRNATDKGNGQTGVLNQSNHLV